MRWLGCLALAACGRFGFEPGGDAGGAGGDGRAPTGSADASTDTAGDGPMGQGLVVWYPLDDTFVGNAADSTANGHHAQCSFAINCPLQTPGRVGGAGDFFAMIRLRTPYAAAFATPSGFTIAAFVRPGSTGGNHTIFAKPHGASATANSWQLELPGSAAIQFKVRSTTTFDEAVVGPNLSVNVWYHVAGTWDGSTMRLYVDGIEVGSMPFTNLALDSSDLLVGADLNSGTETAFFQGYIDDVRLYDRALAQFEIMLLAAQ